MYFLYKIAAGNSRLLSKLILRQFIAAIYTFLRFFLPAAKHEHQDSCCQCKNRNKLGGGEDTDGSSWIISQHFDQKPSDAVKDQVHRCHNSFVLHPLRQEDQEKEMYKICCTGK